MSIALGAGAASVGQARSDPAGVRVLVSGGFTGALQAMAGPYRQRAGATLLIGHGPSMGSTPEAIPQRLAHHERADVVILARPALDALADKGEVVRSSITDLGLSRIAVAVGAGAPAPDISTPGAVRAMLLRARSVAWSDSASGVYIQNRMLGRLGVRQQVMAKGQMIPATPVGEIVARGRAEIGFQQLSELKPIAGIHIVGLLPASLQKVTPFSAGVVKDAPNPIGARQLIAYLASPQAAGAIRASGLDPVPHGRRP